MGTRNTNTRRETTNAWVKSTKGVEVGPGSSGTPGTMQMTATGLTFPDGTTQTTTAGTSTRGAAPASYWSRANLNAGTGAMAFCAAAGTAIGLVMPAAGKLVGISVSIQATGGSSTPRYTLTVYKNGVATTCTVTIDTSATRTGYAELTTPLDLAAGDELTVTDSSSGTLPTTPSVATVWILHL